MNFHKKIVVYYYGILFILEINTLLRKFILWDQSLSKGLFLIILRDLDTLKIYFLCLELFI